MDCTEIRSLSPSPRSPSVPRSACRIQTFDVTVEFVLRRQHLFLLFLCFLRRRLHQRATRKQRHESRNRRKPALYSISFSLHCHDLPPVRPWYVSLQNARTRSGLNASAIRYYERRGLLPVPTVRAASAGTPRTHSTVCSSSALQARWDSR